MLIVGLAGLAFGMVMGPWFKVGILVLVHAAAILATVVVLAGHWVSLATVAGAFASFSIGCQVGYIAAATSVAALRHRTHERLRLGT